MKRSHEDICRKAIEKASLSLEAPYSELLDRIPLEAIVNVDETGHKENGDNFWTWVFNALILAAIVGTFINIADQVFSQDPEVAKFCCVYCVGFESPMDNDSSTPLPVTVTEKTGHYRSRLISSMRMAFRL